MSEYIAFDSHKRYTWVDREDHSTGKSAAIDWSMLRERCESI